jgi:hypothetical protein
MRRQQSYLLKKIELHRLLCVKVPGRAAANYFVALFLSRSLVSTLTPPELNSNRKLETKTRLLIASKALPLDDPASFSRDLLG